jgi:EmrB/QacA subfamily drug resistance transporter
VTALRPARTSSLASPKVAVGVVYVAAIFLSTLDTTIVNVALPAIGRDFGIASASVGVVSVCYLVSLATFMPASGWIGDRIGSKTTLLVAIALFTLASALCGTATNLGELVAYRVLQGLGGGMLAPVGMTMLLRTFPPAERVRTASILTIPVSLAPALGPLVGGALVSGLSWRWVFYVNLPVGIAAVIFGAVYLPSVKNPSGPFDLAGFLAAGLGLGLTMYGVSEGPVQGWTRGPVLAAISAGVALLITMVVVELRQRAPIVDLRLFANRLFGASAAIMMLESVAFLGALYIMSLYLQDGRRLSALAAGLCVLPEPVGVLVGAQVASRLVYQRLGPRRHLAIGLGGTGVAMALLSIAVGAGSALWWVRAGMFALGLAVGQVFVATQAAAFAGVSTSATGRASTLFNVGRRVGGAVGVALATTVMSLVGTSGADTLAPYRAALLVTAAICLVSVPLVLRVRDADAASTLVRRS